MAHHTEDTETCSLCGRQPVTTTEHHLTPKELGGTFLPTARLCIPCHKQIHALYTNEDLVRLGLTTIASLQKDPQLSKYIRWIRKQPPGSVPRTRKSRHVRGRG